MKGIIILMSVVISMTVGATYLSGAADIDWLLMKVIFGSLFLSTVGVVLGLKKFDSVLFGGH
ncbi:hypothetical protein [Vibrio agarivorans]|uniref:Uncharacterized protein n=1 Tax=Vibrio agarivorans TaxID=153622 RepID=A0ABT7Y5X8_9VIBR|nr:hypothetical protein [Vibrio agarivorans]MDN2483463.1 hypothetical protein [Vibrio agarivorans]